MRVKTLLNYQLQNEVSKANFNINKRIYNWPPFMKVVQSGLKSQNWFSLLFCTNFGRDNKNPIRIKFSDPVFSCFWLFKDLIYANLCWLDAKLSFANILNIALRFKIHGPNFIWRLLLMTYVIWLKLVTTATSNGIRINYLRFWWHPS